MNAEWNKSFLSINLHFYPILYVFLPSLLTVQEMTCQSKTSYTLLMYVVLLECVVPLFICPCFFHVHNLRVFMRHEAYINLQAIWNVVYVNNLFNKVHENACVDFDIAEVARNYVNSFTVKFKTLFYIHYCIDTHLICFFSYSISIRSNKIVSDFYI